MKKVLITGGAGFIGSNLTKLFLKKNYFVTVFDKYNFQNNWGWLEEIKDNKKLSVKLGDIRDFDLIDNLVKNNDEVIHLAALIGIPYSYESPLAYIKTNIEGTYNILESCRKNNNKKVIITSTSEVYGSSEFEPMNEEHPTKSQSPYAASKKSADELSLSYYRSFNSKVNIIRPFNTFGPKQSARAVIPNIIFQLLNKKIKYVKLGNIYPRRDYTYVNDLCDAYFRILNLKKYGEIFNVATALNYSIEDIYNKISKIVGIKKKIKIENIRKRKSSSEVISLRGDYSKINFYTKWEPTTQFEKGLKETIKWVKKNPQVFKDTYNI
jgi:dTDP-glucose 4,6-dehydratase|tara:strand:+ start:262 stop:1233 length:972 start_codon:yes stop_codon:yes gene_type:complete